MLLMLLSAPAIAGECRPTLLRPGTLGMVKPYLEELTTARTGEMSREDKDAHRGKASQLFYAALDNKSKAGDEAIAYLLNIYHGEADGYDIVCEAMTRGKRLVPLIERYQKCLPLTGLEPLHENIKGSGSLPRLAIEQIQKDNKCRDGLIPVSP